MRPKVKEINLLPKEYIQAQRIKTYILMGVLALILECILFVVTIVLPPINQIKQQENILLDLQVEVNDSKFAEVNQTIESLNKSKEDIEKWVNKYKNLKKPNFVSGELLDELAARVPEGTTIDMLEAQTSSGTEGEASTEGPTVIIKGRTQSSSSILNYITTIEALYKEAAVSFNVGEGEAEASYQKYDITVKMPLPQAVKAAEALPQAAADSSGEPIEDAAPQPENGAEEGGANP